MAFPPELKHLTDPAHKSQLEAHLRGLLQPLEGILSNDYLQYAAECGVHYFHTWRETFSDWETLSDFDEETPIDWARYQLHQDLGTRETDANFSQRQQAQMWAFCEGDPVQGPEELKQEAVELLLAARTQEDIDAVFTPNEREDTRYRYLCAALLAKGTEEPRSAVPPPPCTHRRSDPDEA